MAASVQETTDLSKQYDTPMGLAHTTMQALKDRIKLHYDLASDYYLSLWYVMPLWFFPSPSIHPSIQATLPNQPTTNGPDTQTDKTPNPRGEHIHHGYWPTDESKAAESKEQAQLNLIRLLLDVSRAELGEGSRVLDVGCGVGGTSRHLASAFGCAVTGITISSRQVEIATRLTKTAAASATPGTTSTAEEVAPDAEGFYALGKGRVKFVELDAEKMGEYFGGGDGDGDVVGKKFDAVWISEALSHFPDKALFFRNARAVLRDGGRLVLADWFKAEGLGDKEFADDIKPIEGE